MIGDAVLLPSSIILEVIRHTNTNNWGKVSAKVSEKMKEVEGIVSIDTYTLLYVLLFFHGLIPSVLMVMS